MPEIFRSVAYRLLRQPRCRTLEGYEAFISKVCRFFAPNHEMRRQRRKRNGSADPGRRVQKGLMDRQGIPNPVDLIRWHVRSHFTHRPNLARRNARTPARVYPVASGRGYRGC